GYAGTGTPVAARGRQGCAGPDHPVVELRLKSPSPSGRGVGVRVRGRSPLDVRLHEASPVPSSGASRHLLPKGEGKNTAQRTGKEKQKGRPKGRPFRCSIAARLT